MTKIAIWALDGGLSSTIAGTIDVFHVANLLWKNRHPDTNASTRARRYHCGQLRIDLLAESGQSTAGAECA